jgi:prepilin-type N-terminal cleavage/methylation domain-containing protein
MKRMQAGFTMIELIVVIVILGVLAAVAMPKFTDLSADAEGAAVKGVAGAAASAMNINYGARKVNGSNGVAIDNCQDAAGLLQGGALPAGYSIASVALTNDGTATCTVSKGSYSAEFTGLGIN